MADEASLTGTGRNLDPWPSQAWALGFAVAFAIRLIWGPAWAPLATRLFATCLPTCPASDARLDDPAG